MQNQTFPRWSAPLLGAIVGGYFGLMNANREGRPVSPESLIYGSAAGAAAGSLILLLDRPRSPDRAKAIAPRLVGRAYPRLSRAAILRSFTLRGRAIPSCLLCLEARPACSALASAAT